MNPENRGPGVTDREHHLQMMAIATLNAALPIAEGHIAEFRDTAELRYYLHNLQVRLEIIMNMKYGVQDDGEGGDE